MPVEIEAKMKVEDHEPTRTALKQFHADSFGVTLETNTFFDTPDGSLYAADKGLRLRINDHLTDGTSEAVITFKGPRKPGLFKSREETEFTVSSAEEASSMFHLLGFKQSLQFQKKRESWRLNDCKVELDELPYLGKFVEVEGPSEAVITAVRNQLGLSDAPTITTSYSAMIAQWLDAAQKADRVVVFPNE